MGMLGGSLCTSSYSSLYTCPSRKQTLATCRATLQLRFAGNMKLIKVIVHFNASVGSCWFNCTVRIFLSVAAVTLLLSGPTERARFLRLFAPSSASFRSASWPRHSITVFQRRHCSTTVVFVLRTPLQTLRIRVRRFQF